MTANTLLASCVVLYLCKMAGIYVHIPFCKKACSYCDFHFTTSLKHVEALTEAICTEISLKKNRLPAPIQSIYFGGGTPSVLSAQALGKIFEAIYSNFNVLSNAEITLEANPDDLTDSKIASLKHLPINRLSIGIQSFFEADLQWMNRAHTAIEAETCLKSVQDAGFSNLTVDLIFGYPSLSNNNLIYNVSKAVEFDIPHISAYALTIENKTLLAHQVAKGKIKPLDDGHAAQQFLILSNTLKNKGYDHYEISNYGKPGKYAIHNTNYWLNVPYLGLGPSAHGFDGAQRYFNVANNAKYIDALAKGILPESIEVLSFADRFNEYVMTSLRTMWGIDLQKVATDFGMAEAKAIEQEMAPLITDGKVIIKNNSIILTPTGQLFADGIAASLFL